MTPHEAEHAWVQAATTGTVAEGVLAEGVELELTCSLTSTMPLGTENSFRAWTADIDLVEWTDRGYGERWTVAYAIARQFAVPRADRLLDLVDEADEDSGELLEAVVAVSREIDAVKQHRTRTALYIQSVYVAEPARGHGWGRTALANLVGALWTPGIVVLAHEPLHEPTKGIVRVMGDDLGAERIPDTNMRWIHTSRFDRGALDPWLTGRFPQLCE